VAIINNHKQKTMKKIIFLIAVSLFSLQSRAQVLASQNFDVALGWTSTTIANDAGTTVSAWTRKTAGTTPTCTPFAGAGMARFNSYNIPLNGTGRLTSPAITFAGANYRVGFKMYRDDGYPTDGDNVQVYFNTTAAAGGTLLGTINRSRDLAPIEAANGWYSYAVNVPAGTTGTGYITFLGTSAYGNNIFIDEVVIDVVPSDDAAMNTVSVNPIVSVGSVAITGSFKNNGLSDINSLDLNWLIDNEPLHTQSLTGLALASSQSIDFTHADQWAATSGVHVLKVWVSNLNGGAVDADLSNNELVKTINVVNEIFPRTVVYEEGTGTWCGWCPRGAVGLKDMLHNHTDGSFIGIAVHNGDPMVVAAYDTAIGAFISGYPSGTLNRFPGAVDPGITSLEPAYQDALTKTPLGKISLPDVNWNPTTREITFDVESKFALDIANANYSVGAIIVENGVTGITTGYNQTNYYSSNAINLVDWEGINWKDLGNPIPAATMVYNHVGRALLGGFGGFANSIPTSVTYNTPYAYSFSHTLPTTQNVLNVEVVAVLLDKSNGQIVNANNFDLGTKIRLATTNFATQKVAIFPNPSSGLLKIQSETAVKIQLIDVLGKVVFTASNVSSQNVLDISSLQKGLYLAKITGDNINYTEKVILK
jgi:Secretion system C-terminal sorting domain/Outer membrane protein Omp28